MMNELPPVEMIEVIATCKTAGCENCAIGISMQVQAADTTTICGVCGNTCQITEPT